MQGLWSAELLARAVSEFCFFLTRMQRQCSLLSALTAAIVVCVVLIEDKAPLAGRGYGADADESRKD